MTKLALKAPLSGYLMPIEQVPDTVFSEKMLGDGVAIDPVTSILRAPCDGRVVQLHEGNHALTIATEEGIELLIHIGLDTVQLQGDGFQAHVQTGDDVKAGDVLIAFDPDYVAQRAPSLLTMVVVVNSDKVSNFHKASGEAAEAETVIMNLSLNGGGGPAAFNAETRKLHSSDPISFPNELGLHARPAAVLASLARAYTANIRLVRGEDKSSAKSIIGLMNLDIGFQDEIVLEAIGPDALEAIDGLCGAIVTGLGEEGTTPAAARASVVQAPINAPAPRKPASDPNIIAGMAASPGLAVGNVLQFRRRAVEVEQRGNGDQKAERAALDHALAQAALALEALQGRLLADGTAAEAAIFAAQEEMLHDPTLLDMTQAAINNNFSAAYAWQAAVNAQAGMLEELENPLLASRAADLRDAGRRVLFHLTGFQSEMPDIPLNTVLIAEELSAADIAALDRDRVVGFATALGGATSHASILARAMDLPALAGIEARALALADGTPVILDATRAKIRLHPRKEEIAYIVGMLRKREQRRKVNLEMAHEPAVTKDGYRMRVMANIDQADVVEDALAMGADGIGLLRTEFLFMNRRTPPGEQEQAEAYAAIAGVLGSKRPLIVRTLDAVGSKQPTYFSLPAEDNPYLGQRGIRAGLDRPQILRTQVRAVLRAAAAGGNIHIALPMIATLEDWRQARALVDEEVENLGAEPLPLGIMVEAPAAAIMAEQFAREADFFSINANDLAQYVLAMDRNHPKLGQQIDGLNPAVLRLIAQTVAGARKHKRWIGVCGAIASDPQAVPLLIGMGVQELSASMPAIPTVKALIRSLSLAESRQKAKEAIGLDSAADVRALFPVEDYEL